MEELRNFNLAQLYERLLNWSDDIFVEWLQNLKLLHSSRTCECGTKMRLRPKKNKQKYQMWQCPVRNCQIFRPRYYVPFMVSDCSIVCL